MDILLPPRSPKDSRAWIYTDRLSAVACVNLVDTENQKLRFSNKRLIVIENPGESFASFSAISLFLRNVVDNFPEIDVTIRAELSQFLADFEQYSIFESSLDGQESLDAAVQFNGRALAALRRVSRESTSTALLIDRAARQLIKFFEKLSSVTICILNAHLIDRPSLKVFARICLLTPSNSKTNWLWTSTQLNCHPEGSLFGVYRDKFLESLIEILDIRVVRVSVDKNKNSEVKCSPGKRLNVSTVAGACGWLTTQNYDAALYWAEHSECRDIDYFRYMALVLTNLGQYDLAIEYLQHASTIATNPSMRCHVIYMEGLIWAKRKYNLNKSDLCFEKALKALEESGDAGDAELERAWVFNGQAMNVILNARIKDESIEEAFKMAYKYLTTAFESVKQGASADRVYLRFNLLGNMSSLMEIQGSYDIALDLIEKTFDENLADGQENAEEWLANLMCKKAALVSKSGKPARALEMFRSACEVMENKNRPICAETLMRSVGGLLMSLNRPHEAIGVYEKGLECALSLRSAIGSVVHGQGLANAFISIGVPKQAEALIDRLSKKGVWLVDKAVPVKRRLESLPKAGKLYGMSTSIPEVDLEELAKISIAQTLHGTNTNAISGLK